MSTTSTGQHPDDDEISLKELLLTIQSYWQEFWRFKWLIILITIPFIMLMLFFAISKPVTYPTKLTFMVDDGSSSSLGAVSGLLGSFGLGGAGGEYNVEQMLALVKSRKIIQSVLFKNAEINGKEDFYANHLIEIYSYHEKWEEDTLGFKNFYFVHDSVPAFDLIESSVLKQLHSFVIGNPDEGIESLLSTSNSESTGIMTLSLETEHEELSIKMLKDIYEELSRYYVKKSTEKQQHTYDALKFKTDSTLTALRSIEYQLANFKDRNYGLFSKKDQLKVMQLEAQVKILYTLYGETLKNLEVTEFALRDQTPVIQIIDAPIPPIKPVDASLAKAIIIGGILGGFLAVLLVGGRKLVRDVVEKIE